VTMDGTAAILWRRLDRPGHESARISRDPGGWLLAGGAVFAHEGQPCRLDYRILCDQGWRTRGVMVRGWVGGDLVDLQIRAGRAGRWQMNRVECPQLEGCIDVDLNFSPSTNLLPIRRLGLQVGEEAEVRAAWLRFPGFALEPLEQRYTRTAGDGYRYESGGGSFVRDLAVNADGFVTRYPGFFEADAPGA